ncbi:TPA: hypothetical protein ACMDPH_003448 [Vibrio cholerae]
MKAAILTKQQKSLNDKGVINIPAQAFVFIRSESETSALVKHKTSLLFNVKKENLEPIDSAVLMIDWLNRCPKCDAKVAYVETESTDSSYLFEGDKVHCAQCDKKGAIEVIDCECVECVWDEEA